MGLDCSPGFTALSNDQILWLLPEGKEMKITKAGAMNFFVVVNRDDDGASFVSQL